MNNSNFWKWGNPEKQSHLSHYPKLKLFLEKKFNTPLKEDFITPDVTAFIKPSRFKEEEIRSSFPTLKTDQISFDKVIRLRNTFGKSYNDIIRSLTLKEIAAPDFILFPETTEDIVAILKSAGERQIKITTFSGGSNVVGAFDQEIPVPFGVLNMERMSRLVELDECSHTATFEAGIFGPALEQILHEKGFTLGHFPQSFEFSTLGGWLAMRSAGQESGLYGKIEDMLLWIKVITPSGIIENIDFPKHACGIDVHQIFLGSEGTLGIIAQAKMRIHKKPEKYIWKIALFRNFEKGSEAVREIIQSGIHPAIIRLSDVQETQMYSLLSHTEKSGFKKWMEGIFKARLKAKGYAEPSILMMRFALRNPGDQQTAESAMKIALSNEACPMPSSIASNWENSRFSLPYLRDTLVEHRVLIDTFETVAYWKNLQTLYHGVKDTLKSESDYFDKGGILFCHISHAYETGASLYFTLMAKQETGNESAQWQNLKKIVSDAIIKNKGAISHHHGIGKDHRQWYLKHINPATKKILQSIKHNLDPENILNPGKLSDEKNQ